MFHATEFDLKKIKTTQFRFDDINVLKRQSYGICGICVKIPLEKINLYIFKPWFVYIQNIYYIKSWKFMQWKMDTDCLTYYIA